MLAADYLVSAVLEMHYIHYKLVVQRRVYYVVLAAGYVAHTSLDRRNYSMKPPIMLAVKNVSLSFYDHHY
jgi:hypothetical protein